MIRITLLTLLIAYLSAYAWKDWFRAACWLVLLVVIIQHPDMPKSIFGIPGFNLWNVLFLNVVLSWLSARKKNRLKWDMPSKINTLFFIYALVILLAVFRLFMDQSGIKELADATPSLNFMEISTVKIFSEYIINCFKWTTLAFIIFEGAKTEDRVKFGLWIVVLVYILFSIQVIKSMGLGSLKISGDALQYKAFKVLSSNVGFHRVNLSMMLSGGFWMVFCMKEYVSSKKFYFLIIPMCLTIFVAQALTGGRMGYVTWAILGFLLCIFKWRKYFLLIPFVIMGIGIIAPSAIDRLTTGLVSNDDEFSEEASTDFEVQEIDTAAMTSGRVLVWPMVVDAIYDRPIIGYGRLAMTNTTGITLEMINQYGEGELFPHPHNAYLELLLETGLLGSIPIFYLYYLFLKYSFSLFIDNRKSVYIVVGGATFSILVSLLVAGFGSQSFYPREGSIPMWCLLGLMLRVYVDRKALDQKGKYEIE